MIRNVLFDWSGTLVDDLPAVWAATNHVLRRAGRPELSLAAFRAEFCLPFTGFYDRHVPDVPLAQLEVWFHTYFRQAQDSVVVLPHAAEFLQFCRQRRWHTGVLSTVRQDHFIRQAERTGLGGFFDVACVGVRDKRRKIHALLAENDFRPDETLLVGDMQHDIETARYGGVRACAVLTGYNTREQLQATAPDLIVEHLGELRDRLEAEALSHDAPFRSPTGPPTPPVAVRALVFDAAGRVLLVHGPASGHNWDMPGGEAQRGECWPDALRRALKQQAGLDVADVAFVQVQDNLVTPAVGQDGHFVWIDYTCRSAAGSAPQAGGDRHELRWVMPQEAVGLSLAPPARALLETVTARTGHESR